MKQVASYLVVAAGILFIAFVLIILISTLVNLSDSVTPPGFIPTHHYYDLLIW